MDTTDETNAMEERIEGPLGLDVVCPGSSPTIEYVVLFRNTFMPACSYGLVSLQSMGLEPTRSGRG